ncbi:uncharacterized protein CXorf66 homolog [Ochotona princeps]|uniref:uncharacterized protein CXorf66 homolog n=1 Tax=Ochotona princeps TaxID=9978 RepID=UPI0027146203|nr:uncharacterized protein CXorf66 homolog [Ochotona princeps]
MEARMENFKRHPIIIIIGIFVIAFVCFCLCFLHYSCKNNEFTTTEMDKKEGTATKSSLSSKIPFSEFGQPSSFSPENQCMLPAIHKLSGPLSPEKSSIPSSAERSTRHSSPRKSSVASSAELLAKSSSPKKAQGPSTPSKSLRSSQLEKPYRMHNLEKACKLAHTHKQGKQARTSYPAKQVRQFSPAYLQYPARSAKAPCPYHPQNQILPLKSPVQKLPRSSRHAKAKRSLSARKAARLSRSQLAKTCQCYNERCLVCKTSEPSINDIYEAKEKHTASSKAKPFSRSFQKAYSWYNVHDDSDSDVMTNDSNDSDREVTIICDVRYNEAIFDDTQNN